jgi:hypothetical protein
MSWLARERHSAYGLESNYSREQKLATPESHQGISMASCIVD